MKNLDTKTNESLQVTAGILDGYFVVLESLFFLSCPKIGLRKKKRKT